ncbi:NAD(P)-dependent oxidoreductase [Sandarakinorhabdus sp.]|uniref:NAD(P)-dependent oxidoreductase n=1 Tax=Sandarakinorhabdus sp. TaxID=1916663 RepID=UPI00333FBC9D
MTGNRSNPVGFIGLGAMGEPMALNLVRSGQSMIVWNRTPDRCAQLAAAGAEVAATASALLARCEIVFLMLADAAAIDAVIRRGTTGFAANVQGRTLINPATVSPGYSLALEQDIVAAGGAYVEAPVSGSRLPAEAGQLLAMLSGDPAAVARVQPLFAPMCRAVLPCGAVPGALTMKLAVNIFLIASITGLAESANFARALGLDMANWGAIVNASQMASDISRVKADKLLAGDFAAQAAIGNVLETNRLIAEAAQTAGIAAPLTNACMALYQQSVARGLAEADMIAVVQALGTQAPADDDLIQRRH